jgi:hypothetical protein
MITDTAVGAPPLAAGRHRNQFHSYAAAALLLIVVAGFAPTLFARGAFFEVPPIPLYLFAHGFIVTGWFVWLLVQARLAGSGRLATHRRAGTFGALYALVVLGGALMATLGSIHRMALDGVDFGADVSALGEDGIGQGLSILNFMSVVVWSNLASAVAFAVLIGLAVVLRRRPDVHKRLMLLGSVAIIGPALARLARWPVFGGEIGPFIPIASWVMYAALIANDLWTRRRPHPVTLLGILFLLGSNALSNMIAASDFGRAFVRSLE